MRFAAPLLFAIALSGSPIAAAVAQGQDAPAQEKPAPKPPAVDRNLIVVQGNRRDEPMRSPLPAGGLQTGRVVTSDARRFVRCMHGVPPALLRPVVEGHFADPATHDALDKLIRTHPTCYASYSPSTATPYYGVCNPIPVSKDFIVCRANYDRAVLIEEALTQYAPNFRLTRADTLGRETVDRFRAREEARGKFRSPMDRRYYDTLACMVQLEPEIAGRLLRAEPGLEREAGLRQQILTRTRVCAGNAKRVSFDPVQFRGYLADAFYHWTIAAKGVETLISAN